MNTVRVMIYRKRRWLPGWRRWNQVNAERGFAARWMADGSTRKMAGREFLYRWEKP